MVRMSADTATLTPETALYVIAAGIVVLAARFIYEAFRDEARDRRANKRFVIAIFTEVAYNVDDLEAFLKTSLSEATLRAGFETSRDGQPGLIPHITDARHTYIYQRGFDRLHVFKPRALRRIVEFYASLERIKTQIDGLQLDSYKTISIDGKINTILHMIGETERACRNGRAILDLIEIEFPTDWDISRLRRQTSQTATP